MTTQLPAVIHSPNTAQIYYGLSFDRLYKVEWSEISKDARTGTWTAYARPIDGGSDGMHIRAASRDALLAKLRSLAA